MHGQACVGFPTDSYQGRDRLVGARYGHTRIGAWGDGIDSFLISATEGFVLTWLCRVCRTLYLVPGGPLPLPLPLPLRSSATAYYGKGNSSGPEPHSIIFIVISCSVGLSV